MTQELLDQAIHQQQLAANPLACAWVSASAGTGKTKVLIDRLLALLLSGVDPQHILCLTFTKAAAAEMQQRLLGALQDWVLQDEAKLQKTLTLLLAKAPTLEQLARARQLYTLALETPGGLKIATIHGFCQTLLNRFPLEAGITPNPDIMDEVQSAELLDQAKRRALTNALGQTQQSLTEILVSHFKDGSFQTALQEMVDNRRYFRRVMEKYPDMASYAMALCNKLGVEIQKNLLDPELKKSYFTKAYQLTPSDRQQLLAILADNPHPVLEKWLIAEATKKFELFSEYAALYLTKKGEYLKKLKVPHEAEATQIYRLNKTLESLELAQKSACLFSLGSAIFQEYQLLKQRQNLLDYEDLIEKTINLLTQPEISPWILYKLDGGIQHLLVDEAQDTNPDQWRVILALTEDFLTPHKKHRTIFVVGDVKQSIYSFQGASPRDFITLRDWYRQKCEAIGQTWLDIDLCVSFRSTPEVLSVVDRIVNQPDHQLDIQFREAQTQHLPFRAPQPSGAPGGVYLLPAVLMPKQSLSLEPWPIPDKPCHLETSLDQVCQQITMKIQELLGSQAILSATGKPIQPKDILVLVKQRGELAPQLIRTLKKQGIPVAGMDRFLLNSHLAVQDLVALSQFLLLPQDDLALACVLKGPLIELTEDELMQLAADRPESLWQELSRRQTDSAKLQVVFDFLKRLLGEVDYLTPYQLYHLILFKLQGLQKFRSHFGREADDALFEFLTYAFKASENNLATLQQFLGDLQNTPQHIKRDGADNSQNQIRLMTVHGSKGLQAPVVFIVEQFKTRTMPDRLLWEFDNVGEAQFMLMRPRNDTDTIYTSELKAKVTQLEAQEDKRLFYVALTRAQDQLYLAGYGDSEIPEASWYQWLKFYAIPTDVKSISDYQARGDGAITAQNWLQQPVKHRKITKVEAEDSPPQTEAMQRGVLIHRLFELLMDLPASSRKATAMAYLKKHSLPDFDVSLARILETLRHEILLPFCEGRAIAEMEIAAKDGTLLRLDRVVMTGNIIKILDFKTSVSFPSSVTATHPTILAQLREYAAAMATIYPNHHIECYLLWTAGPILHYVPEELLYSS
ncbi:UvrD-helicase domain-containing protein [Candidatus Paracaedibacter symbiosus]|uniref:UvrD-helicase domain-containing protein n=1 Tax=Candidatus Paracaedibacter symbiosus TaxID=244582 RepID=UPI000509DB46|nr:UvrD-helicase domain-containing protein [Candidatus Paracaedibacter symbiosus]